VFFGWADGAGHDVFAMLPWHVGDYGAWLAEGGAGELSASTQAARLSAVSSFYTWLQRNVRGEVLHNPAEHVARPPVERESRTRGLDAEEIAQLRAAAEHRGAREYALVQLLVGTGLRISEALGADTRHLRREGGRWYLYVRRKGHVDRVPVQVPDAAAAAVRRYLRGRVGPLFLDDAGHRMSRQAAANRVRSLAEMAGISGRVSPHSLRHAATTLALLAPGVTLRDVSQQMGHVSAETTIRYDRANRRRNNAAANALAGVVADDQPDPDDQLDPDPDPDDQLDLTDPDANGEPA
jgi:integrase/recombinase XerD